MSNYLYPIRQAGIVFLFAFGVLLIPMMIHQYRKYGAVSGFRSIILYSFLFYMIAAFFLVILPLPARESVNTTYRSMMQLRPFQFVIDFMAETSIRFTNPSSFIRGLTEGVVIQPVFNVILTIPFGIYMRYYFQKNLKQTVFLTFCLTLFFELTQLSGLYGYYSGPYRLFDVDDLLLNTLGGVLGYALTPMFTLFFPTVEQMDTKSMMKGMSRVTYIRRFIAYSIDMILVNGVVSILGIVFNDSIIQAYPTLTLLCVTVFYFTLIQYEGQTFGHRIVKIRVISTKTQESATYLQMFARVVLLSLFVTNTITIMGGLLNYLVDFGGSLNDASIVLVWISMGMGGIWFLFISSNILYTWVRRSYQTFYDGLTKTRMISTNKEQ